MSCIYGNHNSESSILSAFFTVGIDFLRYNKLWAVIIQNLEESYYVVSFLSFQRNQK